MSTELPSIAQIVATDAKVREIAKAIQSDSDVWPIEIAAPNGKLRFRVCVWLTGSTYVSAESPELFALPLRIKDELEKHDPTAKIKEYAAKLGYELVKKGGSE